MLITACADAGETERAFKYLKWMEDDGLYDDSLSIRVCIGLLEVCPRGPTDATRFHPWLAQARW
jgi:pentatricopeptide repeat protein